MAKLFRAQANSVSTRAPKKALRKMAEYYQHEAELEGLRQGVANWLDHDPRSRQSAA